jgi:hypothetical protein
MSNEIMINAGTTGGPGKQDAHRITNGKGIIDGMLSDGTQCLFDALV